MKHILLGMLLCSFLGLEAQHRKVEMMKDRPVEEVWKKAKKEHKYVLLDFGSPRCSPCLYIKNRIFTIDSVADFINARFVSADYTQGEEKERLSKKYNVYSEPVLLITDTRGNLMHRMEGKCTAGEMLARLRQGLDARHNLVALQKKYDEGVRGPGFLVDFLETLHIAGLREQKAQVLADIFSPAFDPVLLKEPEYWNIFLRYNESPVSREGIYVLENRQEFYSLFGEKKVDGKIEQMYAGKVRTYSYGTVPPLEVEEYRKILAVLQQTDYPQASEWLVYLMPVQYKFKDWQAMVRAIQAAIDFNILKGSEKQTYMIMMSRQICWYSEDAEALQYALKWMDEVISRASPGDLPALKEEREQIVNKIKTL